VRTCFGNSLPIHYLLVGGAQSYDDHDDYDADPAPPSHDNHRQQRRPQRPPPTPPPKSKSIVSSLAENSYALTTHALSATAKQSGKAAYYLIRNKKCNVEELFGLWRLDQSIVSDYDENEDPETAENSIEVTPAGTIVVGGEDENPVRKSRYTFTPAQMTSSAKLEFTAAAFSTNPGQPYFYRAYVHRKVADPSVIKLKGKIYRIERTGWRGKNEKLVAVGTFVARRRLKLSADDEKYDDDDEEEESMEDEDWSDPSDDGYDADDMLAEEEYDDQDENY
jgi:cell division septation protein DedD